MNAPFRFTAAVGLLAFMVLAFNAVSAVYGTNDERSGKPMDPRNIVAGMRIPDQGYCDQPYVVVTREGHWLCTLTTGAGHEGQGGQHVVATISKDQGKTWSPLIDIEPANGPEASWICPLITPSGRVYGFYTYNGDRIKTLPGSKRKIRADMLGWYCYKYSDDNGKTWSKRHRIPVRTTACDRANQWQGKVQIFWGIDKPKVSNSGVRFAFTKLGKYMLDHGEGWMVHSDNILTEPDVSKIHWKVLPDGEHGIRAKEFGSVQEEHNHVTLGDKRLYMVYRTTMGYPCHTYSSDGGRTWDKPVPMTYTPGGRRIPGNRACPKLWKTKNGKYLFWFHLHGGKNFNDRNPAWLLGGLEKEGKIHWSQPELLLFDDNPKVRMSYPDLIEQDGRYWVTETQKTVARIHELDASLLEGLWSQGQVKEVAKNALLLTAGEKEIASGSVSLPKLDITKTAGMSVDFWIELEDGKPGQVVADARDAKGRGWVIVTGEKGTLRIELNDGKNKASWDCDAGRIQPGKRHHVAIIVDDAPKIIRFIVNGIFCDGVGQRQFGWGRYKAHLGDVTGSGTLKLAKCLKSLRVYGRYLRTSEAVGNLHAGGATRP